MQSQAGFPLEMGATWCHCCSKSNPLYKLASSLGVAVKMDVGQDNSYQFDATGKILNPSGSEYKPVTSLYKSFYSWMENQLNSKDMRARSVGDMYDGFVKAKSLDVTSQNLLTKGINNMIEQEYAASIKNLSAKFFDQDEDFCSSNTTPDALFPTGVSTIVQKMISASSINVVYNAKVTSIDYSGSSGQVKVTTATGAQYLARWVICTLPLGVMQSKKVAFTPPLPSSTTTALYQLNMGALERVLMVFDTVWYDPKNDLLPGWLNPPIAPPGSLWNEWYSLSGTLGRPVLIAWNSGNTAVSALTGYDDASLLASSLSVLSSMFPGKTIPPPSEYHVSRWQTNPWSLGSYSSIRPNATSANLNDRLALPVGTSSSGQVLFAGEHTSSQYFATMHGAILTGQREANRIVSAMSG
jgi:monoamine oxidase